MNQSHHIAFNDIVESLEKNVDKAALIDKNGKSYTYGELKQNITGARSALVEKGVRKGSKVLVFVSMSMELYAVLEALFSIGAKTIFLDPWMKGRKMSEIIRNVNPDLLILNSKGSKYARMLPATWRLKKWKVKNLIPNNDDWIIEQVNDDDSALITFTSGSTGNPKGANRTYAFINAQAEALKEKLIGKEEAQNIDYTNLPIIALAGFAVGNTIVLPKINLMKLEKANTNELIGHLIDNKVTRLVVSPALLRKILIGIKQNGKGEITEILTGGAPIQADLIVDCIENHPDIEFESVYGSTEAEPIAKAPMKEIYENLNNPLRGVYVGSPVNDLQVKVIKSTKKPVDKKYLKANEILNGNIGEIIVCGDHVNKSYYENDRAFRQYKIVDSEGKIWHRTGDIGYIENGSLYLVGRENRIMERDGQKFYPFPLEQWIEKEFACLDLGYVQKKSGEFVIYIGDGFRLDKDLLRKSVLELGYPCDTVVIYQKPLPRDPRHRSKLQIETLI